MIRVFTKFGDKDCKLTEHFLINKHIKFIEIDLNESPQYAKSLRDKGYLRVPVVITDTEEWSGFQLDKLNQLLREKQLSLKR